MPRLGAPCTVFVRWPKDGIYSWKTGNITTAAARLCARSISAHHPSDPEQSADSRTACSITAHHWPVLLFLRIRFLELAMRLEAIGQTRVKHFGPWKCGLNGARSLQLGKSNSGNDPGRPDRPGSGQPPGEPRANHRNDVSPEWGILRSDLSSSLSRATTT